MLSFSLGSTLFPYTTLFRSVAGGARRLRSPGHQDRHLGDIRPWLRHPARAHRLSVVRPRGILRHCRIRHGIVAEDRKSTRLNSSHVKISYAVFCLKKKKIDMYVSLVLCNVIVLTGLYSLSLHDALPLCGWWRSAVTKPWPPRSSSGRYSPLASTSCSGSPAICRSATRHSSALPHTSRDCR